MLRSPRRSASTVPPLQEPTSVIRCQHVVIGGGVVGLAIGASLAEVGPTVVLERHHATLHETSGRNSGVVHAGIYYPLNSLKTSLCVEGARLMWQMTTPQASIGRPSFPFTPRVPFPSGGIRQIGKWIGATTDAEEAKVQKIYKHALDVTDKYGAIPLVANGQQGNGKGFRLLSRAEISQGEPNVTMQLAVESAATGVIDVATYGRWLQQHIETATSNTHGMNHSSSPTSGASVGTVQTDDLEGSAVSLRSHVVGIERVARTAVKGGARYRVHLSDRTAFETECVINAAGHGAMGVFNMLGWGADGTPSVSSPVSPAQRFREVTLQDASSQRQQRYVLHPCKGRYASYRNHTAPESGGVAAASSIVSRLVYPCPLDNVVGLGVHCTLDVSAETLRFGPDAHYDGRSMELLVDAAGTSPPSYELRYDFTVPRSEGSANTDGADEDRFLDDVHQAVRRYLRPDVLHRNHLLVDFVGVRPKLSGPGEPFVDFVIAQGGRRLSNFEDRSNGHDGSDQGFISLFGIESPGLTSSLAFARGVRSLLYR